jgi:cytochrome c-type biogenesis protein CcmH/NrfG
MPARFCPECGTPAITNAKFCIECGTSLRGSGSAGRAAAAPAPGRWQLTTAGLSVLALFVVGGLGIWAAVLSPSPPTPGPGRGVARAAPAQGGAPQAMAQADLPPDHPKVPMQIPAEVKTFIDDLSKKAAAAPKDVATWGRLAQVYYRTAQVDSAYYDDAKRAFEHVLELDPSNTDALRGLGSIHFELDEPADAIAMYGRYLALKPDDDTVRTALGASYVSSGDLDKGIAIFRDIIAKKPDAWPAHYYLGVALDEQGDHAAGLASIKQARALATEDGVRAQIDETLARLGGGPPPESADRAPAADSASSARTPFQSDVEKAFRGHQIMGPRIVRFEWTAPGTGRVLIQNFPMSGMPDEVKQKFTSRLADVLRDAATANPPGGTVKVDIADAASGEVMATILPSSSGGETTTATSQTPFQSDVEKAFRGHQIMGPRIVRFEWTAPGTGRVFVQNFPMSGMPDMVKQKFTSHLSDILRDAAKANPPGGTVKVDIADASSGEVMATVVPST